MVMVNSHRKINYASPNYAKRTMIKLLRAGVLRDNKIRKEMCIYTIRSKYKK